ncbi:MAG TPA: FeoC-like transcriptional regulator [Phycisphaerae bacterium]|nr:FeoC-like transcriptional regulator [Phycisphaerae bacterium]HPS52043.1 FeoC-like transcriptional regulator [Phycisphaerae bacterium]
MILKIKKLLAKRKRMTLGEIAIHFDADPQAIEPMMQKLVDGGIVRKYKPAAARLCGSCKICGEQCDLTMIVYEYLN